MWRRSALMEAEGRGLSFQTSTTSMPQFYIVGKYFDAQHCSPTHSRAMQRLSRGRVGTLGTGRSCIASSGISTARERTRTRLKLCLVSCADSFAYRWEPKESLESGGTGWMIDDWWARVEQDAGVTRDQLPSLGTIRARGAHISEFRPHSSPSNQLMDIGISRGTEGTYKSLARTAGGWHVSSAGGRRGRAR